MLWIGQSGERWRPGCGTTDFGKGQAVGSANRDGSLQWNLDFRISGIDGSVAVTGKRTNAAEGIVIGDQVVDSMGVTKPLRRHEERKQQDLQRCIGALGHGHVFSV